MALAKRVSFLVVLVVLISVRSGRADDLFNNLTTPPSSSADPVGFIGPLADSFSTGSSSFVFDSLTLGLSDMSSSFGLPPCSGVCTMTVSLLSDSSTSPGNTIEMLGSVNDSSLSGAPTNMTFDTFKPVNLQPNTRYWIELTSTDDNSWWQFDGGVNGEFFSNSLGVSPDSAQAYQLEVAGGTSSAVPEPSAVSLLFVGLAVFAFFAAVRRKYQVCTNPL